MSHLFDPFTLRDVTFRNRIAVSPMCEYSSRDGFANDWHLVHLGSRAVGGAGLVLTEATAVTPEGRISPDDLGIWKDEHITMLARIFHFIESHGATPGIQLAHAGRKASTTAPWKGAKPVAIGDGGWTTTAPSAIAFDNDHAVPHALELDEIAVVVRAFVEGARRALDAGCKVVEIHAAHGYLLHEFLSPLTNHRLDQYGGAFADRTRIVRDVVEAVRHVWPERYPLFVRISATDWVEGGWTAQDSVGLAGQLKPLGVDLIDCSTGGLMPRVRIPAAPNYQVRFAEQIRREASIPTGAVGLITNAVQADAIVASGQADIVLMGRQMLRDPYFALHAAHQLGDDAPVPNPYLRAF